MPGVARLDIEGRMRNDVRTEGGTTQRRPSTNKPSTSGPKWRTSGQGWNLVIPVSSTGEGVVQDLLRDLVPKSFTPDSENLPRCPRKKRKGCRDTPAQKKYRKLVLRFSVVWPTFSSKPLGREKIP